MADGGQRLLDVIDDPNALESFLGGLTSASDLLPSAESVDTVVASLAQSLGADYEVDSPNDTLFDTLEASSTNLTDISQSYVPSDFENASVYSSGNGLQQHLDHQHLTPTSTAGQSQSFETQTGTINGGASTDINVEVLVNSTLQQQYPNSVCDSTSSFTNSPQPQQQQQLQQQQQPIQNMAPSDSFNQNYSQLVDIHTQQQNVSQTPSLSSSSNSSSNVNVSTNSSNNNGNNNNECLQVAVSTPTATNTSNLISSVPTIASISSSKSNVSGNITNTVSNLVTTAAGLVSKFSLQQQQEKEMSVSAQNQSICGVIGNAINSVSQLSSSISSTSPANINLQIQQQGQSQPQQQTQFIVSAAAQNINQLVQQQGQAVSFSSMTMGPQLMSSNTNGGLISSVISGGQGGNLMHIQSAAGQPQQFLTIEHPTPTLIATGGTAFGATNLALVSTGGTPTYAVLPTGPQIFSNAIVQPQLQALKNSGQTFFQTASGSIVAANSIHSIQGVQNVNVPSIRAKQQPQLLPKPALNSTVISNLNPTSSSTNITTNSWNTSVSSTSDSNGTGTGTVVVASPNTVGVGEQQQQQQTQHSIGVNMANMGQLLQQQTQHIHQVSGNSIVTSVANGSVRFSQPSFTIGSAGGLGQVMVSGIGNINTTMSSSQPQLAGTTIVLNQFGQPVLLPTGGASQNNGLQLILRQQPAQPQVLTIQAPAGTTTLGAPAAQATASSCKPIVRYVPQMPQNQTVQIQQIQTPNGPAYIAVRCPSNAQTGTTQFVPSQIQQEPVPQTPVQPAPQPVQSPQTSVTPGPVHNPINTLQQQTLGSITQHSQQQITIKADKVERTQNYKPKQNKSSAIPDSSSETPTPKKKPSKKKKKVTLDLEDILKQSGIGDEDLQDDSCFENAIPSHTPVPAEGTNGFQNQVNTLTPPAIKPNGSLNKSRNLPVNLLPPHVHVLKPTTNPPNNKNQRNNSSNSREGAGSSNNNKKAPPKKSPPKRKAPPNKKQEPPAKQPTPSIATPSPAQNKKNSPKTNNSRKKPTPNASATKKNSSPAKTPASSKGNASKTATATTTHVPTASAIPPPASTNSTTVSTNSSTTGPPSTSNVGVAPVSNNSSTQRIVHTIQLTPQNQQLLRNIQAQITRLVALPKRNENEQTALQKLIYLQQQVIATGTPVPNPANLNNLNNNVLTMTGGTPTSASPVPQSPPLSCSSAVVNMSSNNNLITTHTNLAQSPSIKTVLSSSLTPTTSTCAVPTIDNTKINQSSSVSTTTTALIGQFNQANVNYAIQLSPDSTTHTSTSAHNNLLSKEKTDVTNNLPTNDAVDKVNNGTNSTPPYISGPPVVVEDSKIIEQRRAAAKAEEEARARWRKEQFDFLLKRDQDFFVEPDYKTPFTSKQDAVERLMKYHLARDKTEMDFEDFDEEFSDTAVRLLEKFSCMVAKYKSLMLKESMRQVSCAERVMVERTFCNEEKVKLEQDKLLVAQGEILELPPPPSSWAPKLRELVEADLKEIELDSVVNEQVQSAIDSIISCGNNDTPSYQVPEEGEKIEYDAFGVPTSSSSNYSGMNSSSADIDEAVRSILA